MSTPDRRPAGQGVSAIPDGGLASFTGPARGGDLPGRNQWPGFYWPQPDLAAITRCDLRSFVGESVGAAPTR